MLSVSISIDRPKSVPQLLRNRTLHCSNIFKLDLKCNVFFLSKTQFLTLNVYSISFYFETLRIQLSANCEIIQACSCPRLHNCCGEWEGWDPVNWFNHTSWVAIVTPADRPKSVRNRCVIEVFGGVLCVVTLLFGFFCRCKGFCHRAESDLFLFS